MFHSGRPTLSPGRGDQCRNQGFPQEETDCRISSGVNIDGISLSELICRTPCSRLRHSWKPGHMARPRSTWSSGPATPGTRLPGSLPSTSSPSSGISTLIPASWVLPCRPLLSGCPVMLAVVLSSSSWATVLKAGTRRKVSPTTSSPWERLPSPSLTVGSCWRWSSNFLPRQHKKGERQTPA